LIDKIAAAASEITRRHYKKRFIRMHSFHNPEINSGFVLPLLGEGSVP
jgi:hypothetical protein